jgi:hypothetical protein
MIKKSMVLKVATSFLENMKEYSGIATSLITDSLEGKMINDYQQSKQAGYTPDIPITRGDRESLTIICKQLSCTLKELTEALMNRDILTELYEKINK